MVNYGTLEIQRDNLEAAVERFRKAVQLNEANDRAWVGLALVHRHMGDLELSRANIERALDINPKNKTAKKRLRNIIIEKYKKILFRAVISIIIISATVT